MNSTSFSCASISRKPTPTRPLPRVVGNIHVKVKVVTNIRHWRWKERGGYQGTGRSL